MNLLAGYLFGRKSKRRRLNHRRKLGVELLERRQLLTVVSLTPVKDNSLIEYQSPQYSGGASSTLFVGVEHFSLTRMRGLVDFNVAGSIPAGSTINSVTLTVAIELTNSTTTVTPTVELHDVLQNWGQGTGIPTAFMPPFAPTTTNDATWTNTFYPNQNWSTPGGDFSSTVSGTTVFGADGTSSTWNSTSQMVADVQSWLNNPSGNFGWLMKGDETQNSGKMIGSMHSSNPPTLTINYTPPAVAAPPDLVVSSIHAGSFRQGDSADHYTLTVSNTGAGPTSGQVTVTDTLPTGLTPTAATGTGWTVSISGQTVTATRSDALANGGSYPVLTLTVGVASNAPASVTNTAKVAGGGETNTTNDTANDPTTIIQAADLTIGVSHTGQFRQGDIADTYAINVNNVGPGPTSGLVTVTDTLPTGLTPTAAGGTGWSTNISGSTVTATRSDALANGGSYPVLTLTVSVASNAPSSVTNKAQVAGGGELITSNDTADDPTTITQVADLTITNSHTGNFRQGDRADAYTITVNNVGAGPTSGQVTVTDTLPTGLTPTAAAGTGWNTNISGSTVTATRSDALANGGSYPALTLTVSVANNAPASLTNTARVAGGGETNTTNDTANDPTTITQVADLTISDGHAGDFQQGASGDHYTVTVSNVGPGPTTGQVTVTDTLPTGLTPTAAGGTGWNTSISGSTVTATRSDALAQGAAYPVLTITVSVAANAPASVTNIVQVAGGGELNTANDSASDPTTITVPAPDLTISESHAGSFRQGDGADNYTITVNNVGLVPTTGQVIVTDTLPTGLTPTAASGTGWSTNISGSTVTATRSDALANGGSYPALTLTVSVANDAPASVINTAHVAGGGELNTTNDTASDPTTITQVADLTVTESHTGVFQQGDSADTYTITVNNVGPGPTTGLVTVTGTLPTGLTPTAASGTGWNTSIAGQTVTATRSDILANGGSYPALTLTVSVADNAPASVINTAQVAGGGELNTANDTASDPTTIIPPVADLTLTATHTGAFRQGDVADNYTITVDNIGRGSSGGLVTVTDTLPSGLTPTAASGTGWSTSITGQTVTATRSDVLANSASYPALTLSVSVADNAPASVINTAQVAGGGELNTANDTANDPTTITQVADLTVTASHTGDFRQGDVADNYTITVNNVGPGPTTGQVTVTDALPTGLTPTAASGAGWTTSIAGQTVTATRSDALANDAAYPTLTITVSVAGNAPASVTNTVQVAGGGELNTANDTAADSTTILPPPADLTISNSHTGNFQQGDSADTYTITVSNVGLGPTGGQVTVTDSLPTGLTPTAASGAGWSTSISGSTVTATRSDALANGAAYPALTITVSVAGNAPASVTNTSTVSGGGELNTANDTANDLTAIAPAAGSLSGYVYIDANNDGLRITPQGIRHLAIPGVVVGIFSQDSQGNWTEVAGKSPIQTGQDGSYHFDKLVSGTYRIQVTDFPDFLDGKVTAGAIGGAATGTASEDQIVVQLGAGGNGTEYDFGEMGLRPELISRRMTLASAAPLTQWIVQMIPLPVAQPAQSTEISPASTPSAASAFDALAALGAPSGVPTGYAIIANQPLIQAAGASSTGFTFSGAEIGATYRYSITSDGGGAAVTGSGVISAANQAVTGIDVSALPDGTLTFSATLTDATGVGGAVTTTATLDRSAIPSAMPATAAVDSVFGQQSWLQP